MSVHEIVRQNEAGREALLAFGLGHPRELLAGGLGKTVRQTAHRLTEELVSPDGYCCYLKLYRPGAARVGKVAKGHAAACAEWEAAQKLAAAGIPIPRFLAAIWSSSGDRAASAVLIEGVKPGRPLDLLLEEEAKGGAGRNAPCKEREAWLSEHLAPLVARLHAHGFQHRDLYACHLLEGKDPALVLIDVARVRQQGRLSRRRRVKDLAALHYSLSLCLRAPALLRLFYEYCSLTAVPLQKRGLLVRVLRKSRRISRHTPLYD